MGIKAVDIGINQLTNKSYFISSDEDRIYVIDENTNRIIKSLDAPDLSHSGGIDINLETGLVYVGHGFIGDGFYVINGTTDEIIDTIELSWLHDFEINPLNNMLYTIDLMPDASKVLNEFDLETKNIVRSIPIDDDSYSIEISSSKELIYIAHGKGQVSMINTSASSQSLEPAGNISVAKSPSDMTINPVDNKIFLINDKINRISIIDTNNNNSLKTIILNSSEFAEEPNITIDPKNNFIYVSNPREEKVFVIDENSNKLLASIDAGVYPTNLVYSPFGNKLYATSLIDPVSLLNVSKDFVYTKYLDFRAKDPPGISTKGSPTSLVINPITDRLYAIYRDLKEISIIDSLTDKIRETIPLDFFPKNVGLNPQTNTLYVTSNDTLYALNILNNTLYENSLSIHEVIDSIAIDPGNNIVYVHTEGDNTNGDYGLNLGYRFEDNRFHLIKNFAKSKFLNPVPLFFIRDEGGSGRVLTNTYDNITFATGYESVVDTEYNHIKDLVYVLTDENIYAVDFIAGTANKITKMDSIFISDLLINPKNDIIYVSDSLRNLIHVISGTNGTIIDEILVGKSPRNMVLNPTNEVIYIANTDSNSISVIDASSGKLLVPATVFNINPPNSGYIQCKTGIATKQYVRILDGEKCEAKSNRGFEFSNWVENLDKNSTRIVSSIPKADNWYTPVEKFIKSIANNLGVETSNIEAATLNEFRSGNFTANYEMVSPPLPPEYWATLSSFVLTTIVGAYFIPSFIGYTRTRTRVRKLNYFHQQIMSIYDDGNLDREDVDSLDKLKNKITDAYSKGKLTTEHYNSLNNQVSMCYEEIFKQRINSLIKDNIEYILMIKKIEDDFTDAYSKGRLLELHYNLLKQKISEFKEKNED